MALEYLVPTPLNYAGIQTAGHDKDIAVCRILYDIALYYMIILQTQDFNVETIVFRTGAGLAIYARA